MNPNAMEYPPSGMVLVTGGGAGIGEAICRTLADRGWRVAVTDIDLAAAERVAGAIGGVALLFSFKV